VSDWSPDGSRIAYHAGFSGSGGIWVMDADGGDQHQLTGCLAGDPWPCARLPVPTDGPNDGNLPSMPVHEPAW